MSALETLAIGKPLIISDIQGMSWIPDDCAIKFKRGEKDSLIKACNQLIKDKQKRKEIASAGKQFAKSCTWEKIVERYRNIIRKFISNE